MTYDQNRGENEITSIIYGHAGVTRKKHGRYREADPQRFEDTIIKKVRLGVQGLEFNMFDSRAVLFMRGRDQDLLF